MYLSSSEDAHPTHWEPYEDIFRCIASGMDIQTVSQMYLKIRCTICTV